MPKMLHILGSSKYGGAYQVVFLLCELLEDHGITPHVLTTDPQAMEECARRDVGVVALAGIDRAINPIRDTSAILRLADHLRSEQYDLVHTHVTKGGVVGRLAHGLSRVPRPCVHTAHGLPFHAFSPAWFKRFAIAVERICAIPSDALVVINADDYASVGRHHIAPSHKTVLVPNGIDDSDIDRSLETARRDALARLGLPPSNYYIGNVCRLSSPKNLEQFVDTLAALPSVDGKPLHGILIGDGELRGTLEKHARMVGVEDRMHWLGHRNDRLSLMRGFDVFLMTSRHEGLSISLLEAMGMQCPIVTTAIRGSRDAVRDGIEGIHVPVDDVPATTHAVARLLTEHEFASAVGRNARCRFLERYTANAFKQRMWQDVYEPLLDGRKPNTQGHPS